MVKWKAFIPHLQQRAVRKTVQYQVFMEDICAVFGADEEAMSKFERLMNGEKREDVCGSVEVEENG